MVDEGSVKGVQSSGEHVLLKLLSVTLSTDAWCLACVLSPPVGAG